MRSHTLHHGLLCAFALISHLGEARAGSTAEFPDVPEPKATASRGSFELTPAPVRPVSSAQPATTTPGPAPAPAALSPTVRPKAPPGPPQQPPPALPAETRTPVLGFAPALSLTPSTPATYASSTNDNPYADYGSPNTLGPRESAPTAKDSVEDSIERRRTREAWMLSLEAVTHAPIDMGVQLGLETPQRLRLSAGYGWVPGAYMSLLTGIASSASGNSYAQAFLDSANYSGRTWRLQGGIRPFPGIGLYADVGYAHLNAVGSLELTATGVPVLGTVSGGYRADTTLHLWLVELGYQGELGDRVVLALALGCMGTLSAKTTITPLDSAPRSNALSTAAADADAALNKYGYAPTLTLRLGFDLI